ncbi:MAG: hypothetical protein R2838_01070 [Caldilineaceae bacterium]
MLPPVALSATAGDINFNWGGGSPHPRRRRSTFRRALNAINYASGFYRIMVQADDGVRAYLTANCSSTNGTAAPTRLLRSAASWTGCTS